VICIDALVNVFVSNVVFTYKSGHDKLSLNLHACSKIQRATLFKDIFIVVKGNLALSCPLACLSVCLSMVLVEWISVKFCIWVGLQKSAEKIQVCVKSDKNNRHFACRSVVVDDYVFLLISPLISWTGKDVN
jgi:hypothetical protein